MGFVLNFAILFNTQTNGPLSTTIMGSSKNVLTTYLGIFGVGGDYIFTVTNFIGLNISMCGALLYNYVKFMEKKKKAKKIEV
jgi:solute carrier family 35 protein